MADKVEIIYAHHTRDHVPGDREAVDAATAKALVRTGRANYATKVAVEGDAGAGKTARARGAASSG